MVWSPALLLGVAAIDADHRDLAALLQRIEDAIGSSGQDAARLLAQFVQAMDRHVAREEMLIGDAQVAARRREEHQRARAVLCDHPDSGDPELLRQLVDYARAWYVDHVIRQDLPLRPLFVERGLAKPGRGGSRLDFLKVKWRIALVALLPLLALLGAVGFAVAELRNSAAQVALLRDMNDLNARVGAAVHELQYEGGLAAMHLGNPRAWQGLAAQMQRTDAALDMMYGAIARVAPRIHPGTREQIDEVMAALSLVPETREDISSGSFDAFNTIDIYASTTQELVRLVPEVIRTDVRSDFSRNAVAYVFLLEAKERAGREMAMGAATALPGGALALQPALERLAAEQTALENGFASLASRDLVEAWQRDVGGPRSNALSALRRQLREGGSRPSGADWFDAASLRIDAMRQVEVMLGERLAAEALALEKQSLDRAVLLGAAMVALLVLSVLVVAILGWSILPQLRALGGALRRLADGERTEITIPGLDARDELGDVARVVQQLRERLVLSDLLGARKWTENADRLRLVTDNVPGVVFRVVEPFGGPAEVAYVSRKLREVAGVAPEAVVGRPLHRLLRLIAPPGDGGVLLRTLDHSARRGRPIDFETRVGSGPQERWFRIVASPSRAERGTAWDGLALDITALRRAEEERGRATAQLSHMYRLHASAEMAEAIGHEIDEVLQPILGHSEMALAGTPAASPARRHIEKVVGGVRQALRLVERVLSIGRQAEPRQPVDLAALVGDSVELIRPLLPDAVALEADHHGGAGLVLVSPNEVHQMLSNLCAAVVPVLSGAAGRLCVTTTTLNVTGRERSGAWMRLSLTVRAPGLDDARVRQAFAPLLAPRADGRTLGVGLTVVRSVAEETGGWIDLASEAGQGTIVNVYLPVAELRSDNVVCFAEAASSRGTPS